MIFVFEDFHVQWEPMGLEVRATDRKSESIERWTNRLLDSVFCCQ